MMMHTMIPAALLCVITCQQLAAQDTAKGDASLTTATVYFGRGAELTHQLKVPVTAQTKSIVISRLSTQLDVNSLQISLPEHTALLSQRFTVVAPPAPVVVNPLIKKLQDSIRLLQKEQGRLSNSMETEQATLDKTNRLIEIAMQQNSGKTISSEEAIKLIQANTSKIEKSRAALYRLKEDMQLVTERISDLQQRIQETVSIPVTAPKPYGQLILQVICTKTGEIPVSFSYFTPNAGFTPLYDVRVQSKTNEIKLVYKASVTQSTGIDWKQVKLTLSTANPNWSSVAPLLSPWYLQPWAQPLYRQLQPAVNSYQNTIQSFSRDESLREDMVITSQGLSAKRMQAETVDPSTLQRFTTLSESQLNTNFEIDLPYSINSDGELHSVTIKEEMIRAQLKNYAVPKLDRDAYLLAELTDWQQLNLLPGVANIIMDNTYLGKSVIDPNSTADTLNLSLGKDRRVAVKREAVKAYTSTKSSGSSTKQVFTYELTVKNNKQTEVNLLLKDQHHISNLKEVEVKLEDDGGAMINPDNGVLTWKLELKPGESKKVRFSYTVKYPKDMRIANL